MIQESILLNRPESVKRYCFMLDLKNDPKLIEEYKYYHADGIWSEILAGLKEIGVYDMEIYLLENRLVMIMETSIDFDYQVQMDKLSRLDRQAEWEEFMWKFQQKLPWVTDNTKWDSMERIFSFNSKKNKSK